MLKDLVALKELATSKGECNEGKCWCVSNGGKTCLDDGSWTVWVASTYDFYDLSTNSVWDSGHQGWNYGSIECADDKCIHPDACSSRGYWCDDSLLKGNEGNSCLLKGIPLMSTILVHIK